MDPNPSWNGYSIGHWDGETLVIESSGFNDRTWLDITGHPHSEELRITERFSRRDFGHMQLQLTIDDPKAYMRPFTIPLDLDLMPDTELLENVCAENERDAAKIARATLKTIELPSDVLSTFAGEFEITAGDAGGFIRRGAGAFVITLEDGQLMLLRPGDRARTPLVPTSKTHFVLIGSGADVEFVGDGRGRVTGFTFQVAEGDVKASRRGN